MSRRRSVLVGVWVATALHGVLAAQASDAEWVKHARALAQQIARRADVGLVVADAHTGERMVAHNADIPLKPASVQKLMITAAALDHLGRDFTYRTRLYRSGDELWIVGSGDPSLGDERIARRHDRSADYLFDAWAATAKRAGLNPVAKITLDDSIFDRRARHPDWPDDQADRWYQAPVGGLNYNDNCLDVQVQVGERRVTFDSRPYIGHRLIHNALTVGRSHRPIIKRRADSDVFTLSGAVTHGGMLDPVAARRPTLFFSHAVYHELNRRGLEITGPVVRRELSPTEQARAELLHEHRTPMTDVIWRCNNFSQNLFAECLMKSLAAYGADGEPGEQPGSWDAGRRVAERTLERLGVDMTGARLRDGSGLSHENRLTANQVVTLLVRMRGHPDQDVFVASLAQPGEPGSLRTRYDHPTLRGHLRGKTGTIRGVRCLAGYVVRDDDRTLAFAMLVNGPVRRARFVDLCRILVEANE